MLPDEFNLVAFSNDLMTLFYPPRHISRTATIQIPILSNYCTSKQRQVPTMHFQWRLSAVNLNIDHRSRMKSGTKLYLLQRQKQAEASIYFLFHCSKVKINFLIPPELSKQNHLLACMIHTNTRFLLFFSSSCVFEGMPLPSWIRCLMCLAFLFSSNPSEPAFKTQTIDQHCLPFSNEAGLFRCSCSDKKGRKYNLASLANNDGHPRFVKIVFLFFFFVFQNKR